MTGWRTGHKSCVNGHRKRSALAYTLVITFRKEVVCAVPLDTKKETRLNANSGELIFLPNLRMCWKVDCIIWTAELQERQMKFSCGFVMQHPEGKNFRWCWDDKLCLEELIHWQWMIFLYIIYIKKILKNWRGKNNLKLELELKNFILQVL